MQKKITRLALSMALASSSLVLAGAHAASPSANEAATARHFAALVSGTQPKTAELSLFFSMMPKGGDLHHHYSGAIYAEQFLERDRHHVRGSFRCTGDHVRIALHLAT